MEKTKEICANCRHWMRLRSGWGICKKLKYEEGALYGYIQGRYESGAKIGVRPEFGCAYFEPRPKGPFYAGVAGDKDLWAVRSLIAPEEPYLRSELHQDYAKSLMDWLNELWEKGQK